MQSSYQYHFGGQAGKNGDSPKKSPQKGASLGSGSQSGSSMFAGKVDWGEGGGAAQSKQSHVPFGFGGSAVPFGGAGATGAAAKPSFGGPPSSSQGAAAASGFGLNSQGSNRAGTGASFGGPSSSGLGIAAQPSFGGGSDSRTGSAASSIGGYGFTTQDWGNQQAAQHNTNCTSVKEYAYNEDRNQRFRPQMEDTHCIIDKVVSSDPSTGFYAIFDGHGGRQVSDYCAERFPLEIKKEMAKNPADMTQPLLDIFAKINNELRLLDSDGCGSTACVSIVRKEGANNVLYVANIGDTRAVLSKSGQAERLSIDDKCDNAEENARIKSGGGIILDNRLGGVLAVTRAFGDHALTRVGLIATPHIVKYTIKPFDKYLVIASDGIWDELSDQDAISFCNDDMSTQKIAQMIVRTALQRGSKDNISVIVLKFNGATGAMF